MLHTFSNRDLPHGLTEPGRRQMEVLADRLADVRFAAFYCSPILRARQSAEIISARLGIEHALSPALAEYDLGELEGTSAEPGWQRYHALRDAWFHDRAWDARIAGGESFNDIRARFIPFVETLLQGEADEAVLLLGHGGTFHCMLPLILSNITFDFVLEHGMGHSDIVIAEQGERGLVCVHWGQLQ